MADVLIDQPPPATGISCFERPQHMGTQQAAFDDFTDVWMQRYLTDGTNPLGGGLLILPGDILEFDLKIPQPSLLDPADQYGLPDITDLDAARPVGIDMKFVAGPYFSDYDLVDANGYFVANGDRHETAFRVWQRVTASLEQFVGLYLRAVLLTDEGEPADSRRVIYFQRIVLINSGEIRFEFWNGGPIKTVTPSDYWSFGGGTGSFSLVDVGIEGDLNVFGTLGADVLVGPYQSSPIRVVTSGSTFAVTAFDSTVIFNKSGSTTANLPPASPLAGREITFKNIHSTGTVTLDGSGSETIDGSTTYSLATQWSKVTLRAYGGNWIAV